MPLSESLKALADPLRLRLLHLLSHGPLCVCHLHEALEVRQTRVSQQLAFLRERGWVQQERCGSWMIYSIAASLPQLQRDMLQLLNRDEFSQELYLKDRERLNALNIASPCSDS